MTASNTNNVKKIMHSNIHMLNSRKNKYYSLEQENRNFHQLLSHLLLLSPKIRHGNTTKLELN